MFHRFLPSLNGKQPEAPRAHRGRPQAVCRLVYIWLKGAVGHKARQAWCGYPGRQGSRERQMGKNAFHNPSGICTRLIFRQSEIVIDKEYHSIFVAVIDIAMGFAAVKNDGIAFFEGVG